MTTQECMNALLAKSHELKIRQVRREDIAIEKHAEALDELQESSDRILALDSMTRNHQMSSLISEALARIECKTYGTCVECDEEISAKRLAAVPWAKNCIRCQEAADGMSRDIRLADAA
jgi:DnaK suppressor protein